MTTNGFKCDALPGFLYGSELEVFEALGDVYGPLSSEFECAEIGPYIEDDGYSPSDTCSVPTRVSGFSADEPLTKPTCEIAGLYAAIEHLPLSRVLEMAELTRLAG